MESMLQCDIEHSCAEHGDRHQSSRSRVTKVKRRAHHHQGHGSRMAAAAATDPRKESVCIKRVRPGVARWWTAVRTNVSNCCVSPSSISSASHPKTNRAVAAIRRALRSKDVLFTFFGVSMSLDMGECGMLPVLSRLVDHNWIPLPKGASRNVARF